MAGATPAVTSAFGNRPSDLANPVPENDIQSIVNQASQAALEVPQISVPMSQPQAAPVDAARAPASDDLEAQADALFNDIDSGAGPDDMSPLPPPSGLDSLLEQVREGATRIKNSFAVTTPESLSVLKNSGLFDDVRASADGQLQVKRKGRKGWEPFDRDKFELIGDTLDFSRDAVEAIAENVARATGTAAGTVALPGAGTVVGTALAGAGGAVFAKNVGDAIAQDLLKIPRDPERSALKENALAATFGGGFSLIGSSLARRAAARAAVRTEAQKSVEYATKKAAEAAEDIAEVQKSGIVLGEHGRFRLDPQQSVGAGQVPELDVAARELSTQEGFRNFRRQVGNSISEAYDSVARALGAQSGKGATLGDDFVLASKDVRNLEGKMIGAFRQQVDQQLKGVSQPAPRTLQTVMDHANNIITAGHAERQLGLLPNQAKNYMRELGLTQRLLERTQGNMRIDTAFALEKRLTQQINSNINSSNGRPYAIALMKLRDSIRDDGLDMMENAFAQMGGGKEGGNQLLTMFQKSKARYKDVMDATRNLGSLLDQENISKNAFISKMFEGKGSYATAMNAKTLINETNPQLWQNMAGEYFNKLKYDALDPVSNTVDWGQMAKKWGNLDPRLKDELLKTVGIPQKGMDALLRLGTRVQGSSFDAMAKQTTGNMIKGGLKAIFNMYGGASAKGSAVASMLDGMGKDQALGKWLKDGGLEEVLKEMPGMKPGKAQALRDWIGGWTPRVISTPVKAVTKPVRKAYNSAYPGIVPSTLTRRTVEDDAS